MTICMICIMLTKCFGFLLHMSLHRTLAGEGCFGQPAAAEAGGVDAGDQGGGSRPGGARQGGRGADAAAQEHRAPCERLKKDEVT